MSMESNSGNKEEQGGAGNISERSREFLHSILNAAPVGIGVVIDRIFVQVNPCLCAMTGYSAQELIGRSARMLYPDEAEFQHVGTEKYAQIKIFGRGQVETRWKRKDGLIIEVLLSSVAFDRSDISKGVTFTALDITERNRNQRILEARLRLLEYSPHYSTREVLVKTLDEIEKLTQSKVAFYHFLDPDQKTIRLQAWSTNTSTLYCKAKGEGLHYPIEKAGVWVDSIYAMRPVIHNDYAALPHKKGLPEGHVPAIREISVPVIRHGLVKAVLGVGNKETPYDENDAKLVSQFADLAWDVAERKMMEETIARNEARLRQMADNLPGALYRFRVDGEGRYEIPYMSESGEKIFERPISELIGRHSFFFTVHQDDVEAFEQSVAESVRNQAPWAHEFRILTPGGSVKWLRGSSNPHRDEDGNIVWDGVFLDITALKKAEEEQRRLREQILQSQKMESIGRLAGGVAHDFNNMLGVILGNAEIALDFLDRGEPARALMETIQKAALRSADLVKQLLAFARKQAYSPKILDLNETIEGMLKMLGRLIGENIRLEWRPGSHVPKVMMDPVQLDQILANLCINAKDAITGTGRITIKTSSLSLEKPEVLEHPEVEPGRYAVIWFSDSGCGMGKETLQRVFEPFFTTKDLGKGTGLGLAIVHGIVKQNNGAINVVSQPGKGTTFRIYIPAKEEEPPEGHSLHKPSATVNGSETILLVEDEPMMLEMGRMMLQRLGYRVLTAATPSLALKAAAERGHEIDLLITDVVMPEMDGFDLAEQIRRKAPHIRCLFASGYSEDTFAPGGGLEPGVQLIEKPFTLNELSERVRGILGK